MKTSVWKHGFIESRPCEYNMADQPSEVSPQPPDPEALGGEGAEEGAGMEEDREEDLGAVEDMNLSEALAPTVEVEEEGPGGVGEVQEGEGKMEGGGGEMEEGGGGEIEEQPQFPELSMDEVSGRGWVKEWVCPSRPVATDAPKEIGEVGEPPAALTNRSWWDDPEGRGRGWGKGWSPELQCARHHGDSGQ